MKSFDLEAAKRGEPVCDGNGNVVRRIVHIPEADDEDAQLLVVWSTGQMRLLRGSGDNAFDQRMLFMAPKKRKGWVNVCKDSTATRFIKDQMIHCNEAAAIKYKPVNTIDTVPIEWEE